MHYVQYTDFCGGISINVSVTAALLCLTLTLSSTTKAFEPKTGITIASDKCTTKIATAATS